MVKRTVMIGISQLKDLPGALTRYFQKLPEPRHVRRIAGLVFCLPTSKLTSRENTEVIKYYNYRSGDHVNFYFAGYGAEPGGPWKFSAQEFETCRKELEACSNWRYSGGTDLILLNVTYNAQTKTAAEDCSSAQVLVLEQFERSGAGTMEELFEQIFRYCEDHFDTKQAANPGQASTQHLRQTLIEPSEPKLEDGVGRLASERTLLRAELEAACKRLDAAAKAVVNRITAAKEDAREFLEPLKDFYNDPRLREARDKAIQIPLPQLFVDTVVGRFKLGKFPTTDMLYNHLNNPVLKRKLEAEGYGFSRSTVGRWLLQFKQILDKVGYAIPKLRLRKDRPGRPPRSFVSTDKLESSHPKYYSAVVDTRSQELSEGQNEESEDLNP